MNYGKAERNYGLDVLKIIATVIIIFHHYQQGFEVLYSSGINFYGGSWFYWGYLVELFFMISGYLMYRYALPISEGKISLAEWYTKRALRLLPLLAISVVAYEGLLHIHSSYCSGCAICFGQNLNLWGSLITALGMHACGPFPIPWINSPTWYVGALIILYVIFYIVTVIAQKVKCPLVYAYIFMVVLGCSLITIESGLPFLSAEIGRGYSCFFLGLLLSMYVDKYGVPMKLGCVSALVSATYIFFCMFHANPMVEDVRFTLTFVLYPALILFTESPISKAVFCHRFWGAWSQCSYNAYIWHNVIIFALAVVSYYADTSFLFAQREVMIGTCVLVECIGLISHFLIEKPAVRWLERMILRLTEYHQREKAM